MTRNISSRQLAAITIGLLVLGTTATAQTPRQSELRSMVQQLLEESQGRNYPRPDSSTPAIVVKPEIEMADDGLWYDLGFARIDGENYEIARPFDRIHGLTSFTSADHESVPLSPLYFPIKAQLTVELIRKYCTSRQEQRDWWQPVLERIELIVVRELAAIDNPPARPASFLDTNSSRRLIMRPDEEPLATLCDFDDLVCRTVLAHLDRAATARNVVSRQLFIRRPTPEFDFVLTVLKIDRETFTPDEREKRQQILGAPLFGYEVKLIPQPESTTFYCISDFRFKCLQRVGKERDFAFWQQAASDVVRVAGLCHFAAVWNKDGKTTCSDIKRVLTISREGEVQLTPAMSLPE